MLEREKGRARERKKNTKKKNAPSWRLKCELQKLCFIHIFFSLKNLFSSYCIYFFNVLAKQRHARIHVSANASIQDSFCVTACFPFFFLSFFFFAMTKPSHRFIPLFLSFLFNIHFGPSAKIFRDIAKHIVRHVRSIAKCYDCGEHFLEVATPAFPRGRFFGQDSLIKVGCVWIERHDLWLIIALCCISL